MLSVESMIVGVIMIQLARRSMASLVNDNAIGVLNKFYTIED